MTQKIWLKNTFFFSWKADTEKSIFFFLNSRINILKVYIWWNSNEVTRSRNFFQQSTSTRCKSHLSSQTKNSSWKSQLSIDRTKTARTLYLTRLSVPSRSGEYIRLGIKFLSAGDLSPVLIELPSREIYISHRTLLDAVLLGSRSIGRKVQTSALRKMSLL